MSNDLYNKINRELIDVDKNLEQARDMIGLMKSAGEDTLENETLLKNLEKKRNKWKKALADKGIS